jgi:hypothetical protein
MSRRKSRLKKASPLKVMVNGERYGTISTKKEYENMLKILDRKKHKVRLM